MRRLALLSAFFLFLLVSAACEDCDPQCEKCENNDCVPLAKCTECEVEEGAAWDVNMCDGKGECHSPDYSDVVCRECLGLAWPDVYVPSSANQPCCGDDREAGHSSAETFSTSNFVCLEGVACGDEEGEELVLKDPYENERGCNCLAQDFMLKCSTDFGEEGWGGLCVGPDCCEDLLVDKNGNPFCAAPLELGEEDLGKSCDDVSDAEFEEGKVVKKAPEVTAEQFGCCEETQCWDGMACRNTGFFEENSYCHGGEWVVCGEDVGECESYEDLTCHQDGWGQDDANCGEVCSLGRCGDPDGDGAFECLAEGESNRNMPIESECADADECCTASCVGGVCSAADSCTAGNLGAVCSVDDREGICTTDFTSGEGGDFTCCDSEKGELAVIKGSEDKYRCVLSFDGYEGWTCDNQTRDPSSQRGVVKLSPDNETACCAAGYCLLDGCVPDSFVEGSWFCRNGELVECSPDRLCNRELISGKTFYCRVDGWNRTWQKRCGEGICEQEECIECNLENETDSITGVGDVVSYWLCTSDGFLACREETQIVRAGEAEYLCENGWYECTNYTSTSLRPPTNLPFVQTNDSEGTAVSSGNIVGDSLCDDRVWRACDPGAKERHRIFEMEGGKRFFWCNADGGWLECGGTDHVYLRDDGLYRCGCSEDQACFQMEVGKRGLCVSDQACCVGWSTDGSNCYSNQTEACRWHDGQRCDSLSDGLFNPNGICAAGTCCMDDGPGGRMVVGERSDYSHSVKCVSAARPEDLGKACDAGPDGSFDGFIGYLHNELGCCLKEQACTFEAFEPGEGNETEENVTEPVECGDCDDGDPCTRDYCEDGVCVHENVCPVCGDGICEGDECETCKQDCERGECEDGYCDPLIGCDDPDCVCDFDYDAPESGVFSSDQSKKVYVTVRNGGNFRERFDVSTEGARARVDDEFFYLDPGESKEVEVRVLETKAGLYTLDVKVQPSHGAAFAQSIDISVEEGAPPPVWEREEVRIGVTALIVLVGLLLLVSLGKKLFPKKKQAQPAYQPYRPDFREQMRQQYYYSASPEELKRWWGESAERLVPETEETRERKEKEEAKKEALKRFADALKKVQEKEGK